MIALQAPAKLNLYLRVVGRRPDGFHEIETVFERLDLADTLTFSPLDNDVRLTCTDPSLSCGEDNLVLKAARLLQRETKITAGASIHLEKRIPAGAGLGGGSSDAATTLQGLAELWQLPLKRPGLMQLGAELGSDVPFFLCDAAFARGAGRGERCELLPAAGLLTHVLVTPRERLSTREIYAAGGFPLTADKPSIRLIEHALSNGSLGELATGLWNDLEPEAIRRCPAILRIHQLLKELGCLGVRLSGSGSASFGICRDLAHARSVADGVRQHGSPDWRVDVTHTLMHSSDVPQLPPASWH